MNATASDPKFVSWFRSSAPYIHAHRGKTFVIAFGGEAVQAAQFPNLIHDIALLDSLGIRLVLVHGARPQIEHLLKQHHADPQYREDLRITDNLALNCVKQAVGSVRVEIEALLSMGLSNTPMSGAKIRVVSGNQVIARPLGVRNGIDFQHTGEVRRIDTHAITQGLDQDNIVLLSPIGYSPTGEVFNLRAEDVAVSTAVALKADKLLFLVESKSKLTVRRQIVHELTWVEAEQVLTSKRKLDPELSIHLSSAVQAAKNGVARTHLIERRLDGALLKELFTRDGIGTLVTANPFEELRQANIDDVGGILELITPLEKAGLLVRRSRENLEMEISFFSVLERDGLIVGCAALYPFPKEQCAELSCMAIHPEYRNGGRGQTLLRHIEKLARSQHIQRLFTLTTQTSHWFRENAFEAAQLSALPVSRRRLYNYKRNSKIFIKKLQ